MDAKSFLYGADEPAQTAPNGAAAQPTPYDAGAFLHAPAAPQAAPYSYGVLPLRDDAQGHTHFDINAGLPGSIIRAFTAPGDAYTGKLDPMSEEGQARARELATMVVPDAVPLAPALTREGARPIPTTDQLKTAASAGYDAARATGAEYPGASVSDLASGIQSGLNNDGFLAELAPKTHAVLGKLQGAPSGSSVTVGNLDAARKAFNKIAGDYTNPTEQHAANRVIEGIDDFIANGGGGSGGVPNTNSPTLSPGTGGPAAPNQAQMDAARLITEARANRAAAFRSDRIAGVEDAAELRAAAANSGQNLGNTLRQKAASVLLSDKQTRGFSPDERAALEQVVRGTAKSDALRRVGNLLGGGGGLGQMITGGAGAAIGSAFGSPTMGAAGLAGLGAAARSSYNAAVSQQMAHVAELMRQRSPLYQQTVAPILPSLLYPAGNVAARSGLLGNNNQVNGGLLGPQ